MKSLVVSSLRFPRLDLAEPLLARQSALEPMAESLVLVRRHLMLVSSSAFLALLLVQQSAALLVAQRRNMSRQQSLNSLNALLRQWFSAQ